jgi:hypothetical protein
VHVVLVARETKPPVKPAAVEPGIAPVAPAPAPRPWTPPTGAYVAFGVGAAGLVAGAVLTGLWAGAKHDGDAACGVPGTCDTPTINGWEAKQRNLGFGVGAGFGVAVIGAAIGLGLTLAAKPSTRARIAPAVLVLAGRRGVEVRF